MQAARFRLIRLVAPQRGGKGRFVIGTQEPKNLLRRDAKVVARPLAKNDQSFFASFCSQKEVLSFVLAF